MRRALPQTSRFLNTWKNGFTINASQHSDHFYWIKPGIETFWAQCSGTECWLSPPGHLFIIATEDEQDSQAPCALIAALIYLFIYGRCSTTDQKVARYLNAILTWRQVNVLVIYTGSNHEQKLSASTAAVHSSDWLHLDIFPPMEDALPWTTRIFDTWKTTD